jgi:hypothetical protein
VVWDMLGGSQWARAAHRVRSASLLRPLARLQAASARRYKVQMRVREVRNRKRRAR